MSVQQGERENVGSIIPNKYEYDESQMPHGLSTVKTDKKVTQTRSQNESVSNWVKNRKATNLHLLTWK